MRELLITTVDGDRMLVREIAGFGKDYNHAYHSVSYVKHDGNTGTTYLDNIQSITACEVLSDKPDAIQHAEADTDAVIARLEQSA